MSFRDYGTVMDKAADAASTYTEVKNGGCSQITQNSEVTMSRHLDTSSATQVAQIMSWSNVEDSVVPLERSLHGHPLAGLFWERQFEEVMTELGWERVAELGMSFCSQKTRTILIGSCGRYLNGWNEAAKWLPRGRN